MQFIFINYLNLKPNQVRDRDLNLILMSLKLNQVIDRNLNLKLNQVRDHVLNLKCNQVGVRGVKLIP